MDARNRRDAAGDLLVAVDFQNVYLPGNEWACPSMPDAMARTLDVLNAPNAPRAVFTKYIAPAEPVGRWVWYNREYSHINADAFLCDFPEALKPVLARAAVAEKSVYSSMKCDEVLQALRGKKAVVLAGVVAECCVLATMMEAIDLGYEVVYLSDCVAGQTPENEAAILRLAESFSPVHTAVMTGAEYIEAIKQ